MSSRSSTPTACHEHPSRPVHKVSDSPETQRRAVPRQRARQIIECGDDVDCLAKIYRPYLEISPEFFFELRLRDIEHLVDTSPAADLYGEAWRNMMEVDQSRLTAGIWARIDPNPNMHGGLFEILRAVEYVVENPGESGSFASYVVTGTACIVASFGTCAYAIAGGFAARSLITATDSSECNKARVIFIDAVTSAMSVGISGAANAGMKQLEAGGRVFAPEVSRSGQIVTRSAITLPQVSAGAIQAGDGGC